MSSYGLWLSAAGMKVNEHRQAVLANNMANMNTTGFKYDLAVMTQRRVESEASPDGMRFAHDVLDNLSGGVNVKPSYHNFGQGNIEVTGRPLDVAIVGEGFFSVSDGERTRYTRDGEFAFNTQGEVVLESGGGMWKVLDRDGSPIVVDQTLGPVSVSADGSIRQGETVVGVIGLATTDDLQSLRKSGGNLFEAADDAEMKEIAGRLAPESREASNFDSMRGLATMIEGSRAYQLNATLLQLQDQLVGQSVSTVGRVR